MAIHEVGGIRSVSPIYLSWKIRYNMRMKQKIKLVDKLTGKTLEKEVELRNRDHFDVQLKTRMHIFRNRKKYNRKRKHKGADYEG